jgi:hypothetical protein
MKTTNILKAQITSLEDLLSVYCDTFKDLKEYLERPDSFTFDQNESQMVIHGRRSNVRNSSFNWWRLTDLTDAEALPILLR